MNSPHSPRVWALSAASADLALASWRNLQWFTNPVSWWGQRLGGWVPFSEYLSLAFLLVSEGRGGQGGAVGDALEEGCSFL